MTETWQARLRAAGHRLTPQRQLVLEAVTSLGHATPDEVAAEVRRTAGGVNISTVYRTLELLEDLGLVNHTHLGHGPPTYHAAAESSHLHLVCRRCGAVTETDVAIADGLVRELVLTTGFVPDVQHFSIFGVCASCTAALQERLTS